MDMVICYIIALKFILAQNMHQVFHMIASLTDTIAIFICIVHFLMFAQWPNCLMMHFSKHVLTAKVMHKCTLSDHTDRHVLPNAVHMYNFRFRNVLPSTCNVSCPFTKSYSFSKIKNKGTSFVSFLRHYDFLLKRKAKHFAEGGSWWLHFIHIILSMTV